MKVDLKELFLGLQQDLLGHLEVNRKNNRHPTTKGDVSETVQGIVPIPPFARNYPYE